MDTMIRKLERLAVLGDTGAADKLNRLRNRLRTDCLLPCITLCPIGTNVRFKRNGKLSYMRGQYVSILLDLGDWDTHPMVTRRYHTTEGSLLKNDCFLRRVFGK